MGTKTLRKIVLVLGLIIGLIIFILLPYQSLFQVVLCFSILIVYEGILGIKLVYSFNFTGIQEFSKNHPSFKTGISLLSVLKK